MEENTLNELVIFLSKHNIPEVRKKPKTFLDISKQPHYENVLSNIYAFFFNVNEVHHFKELFIQSLLEIIGASKFKEEKKGLQHFYEFNIDTEFLTEKGGRIDILLHNPEQAIIIENKVYHHLNNNLEDYWKTLVLEKQHKIGVILSLYPIIEINHSHFINITHIQLLDKVMSNSGTYLLNASDKYTVFLKDFYQNIINLSKSTMQEKELLFYFDHQEKINLLTKLKFSVRDHIASEVEKAGKELKNLKLYSPRASSELGKRVRYYISPDDKDLMIAVIFDLSLIHI